jgi:hypothetical protein
MSESSLDRNKAIVLEEFETPFNKRDSSRRNASAHRPIFRHSATSSTRPQRAL